MRRDRRSNRSLASTAFATGQEAAVGRLLAGRSVLAIFPTGGGKSLCYQLPALLLDGLTLVISPLIALMKDQLDFLVARGVPAARLDSSLTREETLAGSRRLEFRPAEAALRLARAAGQRAVPAVARAAEDRAVGRRRSPLHQRVGAQLPARLSQDRPARPATGGRARAGADGHRHARGGPRHRRRASASPRATWSTRASTGRTCSSTSRRAQPAARDDLLLARSEAAPAGPDDRLRHAAAHGRRSGRAARRAAASTPGPIMPGMETEDRNAVQDAFMASDRMIVVATIAFGMGIDKADIRYVYHYNLPKALENYVQEIGRAGRDGRPSICELLACADDVVTLENFSYGDTPTPEAVAALVRDVLGRGRAVRRIGIRTVDAARRPPAGRQDAADVSGIGGHPAIDRPVLFASTSFSRRRVRRRSSGSSIPQRAAFLRDVFRHAVKGRTWFSLDLEEVSRAIGQPRNRIVAAIGYLEEKGDLVVEAAGVRQGYRAEEPARQLAAVVRRAEPAIPAARAARHRPPPPRAGLRRDRGLLDRPFAGLFRRGSRCLRALRPLRGRAAPAASPSAARRARRRLGEPTARSLGRAPRGLGFTAPGCAVPLRADIAGDDASQAPCAPDVRPARRDAVPRRPDAGRKRNGARATHVVRSSSPAVVCLTSA